jgi:hypothetical protein
MNYDNRQTKQRTNPASSPARASKSHLNSKTSYTMGKIAELSARLTVLTDISVSA